MTIKFKQFNLDCVNKDMKKEKDIAI